MRWTITAIAALLSAASVQAQGVSVFAHSGCSLARGGTGVADPCHDGSAVYYNPASLALQPGAASLGALALFTSNEFRFPGGRSVDGEQPVEWAPHLWFAARGGPRVGLGLGIWAPYGLSTKWPLDFEGRFVGYDNTLRGIYIQPTAAYDVIPGRLAIGAGIDFVRGSVEIHRRVDLAATNIPGTNTPFSALGVLRGTDFIDATVDVDDWTTTFNAGVQVRASERWSIGVRYLHTANLDLEGDAEFNQLPTGILLPPGNPLGLPAGTPLDAVLATQFLPNAALSEQRLETAITLPNQLVAGVRYQVTQKVGLLLDYQWTGWSQFDEARLNFARAPTDTLFLDFDNTSTVRFGTDITASDRWDVRTGIVWNEAASPDLSVTPLLAEGERLTLSAGAGYRIGRRFSANAGLELVFQEERPGIVRPRTTRALGADDLIAGDYKGSAVVLALTMSYRLPDMRWLWSTEATTDR
ncbi:MAG: OmpP1/FadL family transporter [Pseudomonas sp.]